MIGFYPFSVLNRNHLETCPVEGAKAKLLFCSFKEVWQWQPDIFKEWQLVVFVRESHAEDVAFNAWAIGIVDAKWCYTVALQF